MKSEYASTSSKLNELPSEIEDGGEYARELYSKLRNERERATFSMMMRMNPEALTSIRKEFFVRKDSVTVEEFIYIINKHLLSKSDDDNNSSFEMTTDEQKEFALNMFELFKDIDVNGDGDLEWQEFTTFTVDRANLLSNRQKLASLPHYHDSSFMLDPSSKTRHRHDISRAVVMPALNQFAIIEDHKNAIFIFNSRLGKHIRTITTESSPIAIEHVHDNDKDILATTGSDMTISTYSLDDPNPNRRYQHLTSWASPGVQMALIFQPESKILYSGSTNGNIYSWKINERNLVSTLVGHTDIVMSLTNLKNLNNIASASLDKTVSIWDSYTNDRILNLQGHKKGLFDLTYTSEYRLLISCGFEHDACVWSPFVNTMVTRLKGHHSSLVGCIAIEGTPELITGDSSGVFKLWDVRNYNCVQTFLSNSAHSQTKETANIKTSCFFHTKLPSRNSLQTEDDSRIYIASKLLVSFDQARVVHEVTTDVSNIIWIGWNENKSVFITVSENNVIIWDALLGSKTVCHLNICVDEITACCLDHRQRKVVLGNITGKIGVFNLSDGSLMKDVSDDNQSAVISLAYDDDTLAFIAGFANGLIKIYDENTLEDCTVLHIFENNSTSLTLLKYDMIDKTVASMDVHASILKLWNYNTGKVELELHPCDISFSEPYILSSRSKSHHNSNRNTANDHLHDDKEYIVYFDFLAPFPLIVTADSVGNVVIWGSRGSKWPGTRISGFLNQNVLDADYEKVTNISNNDNDEDIPRRIIPPFVFVPNSPMPVRSGKSDTTGGGLLGGLYDDEDDENDLAENVVQLSMKSKSSIDTEKSLYDTNFSHYNETHKKIEKKWGHITPIQSMAWNVEHRYLFTGDDLGVLRCFDLYDLFREINHHVPGSHDQTNNIKKDVVINSASYDSNNVDFDMDINLDNNGDNNPSPHSFSSTPQHLKKYICMNHSRTQQSAIYPYYKQNVRFLVGRINDVNSYLGINFKWSLQCHQNRIITIYCMSEGVLTSSADRMVKMWNFNGEPIGKLLQSVPIGIRNKAWNLNLSINKLIKKEREELNNIIVNIKKLADTVKPLDTYDFTGMEPGENAAEFSQSLLRKRIDKSTNILGLKFDDNDDFIDDTSLQELSIMSSTSSTTLINSVGSKSAVAAMKEVRSIHPSVDYAKKTNKLSYRQRRTRQTKFTNISNHYGRIHDIHISNQPISSLDNLGNTNSLGSSELSRSLLSENDSVNKKNMNIEDILRLDRMNTNSTTLKSINSYQIINSPTNFQDKRNTLTSNKLIREGSKRADMDNVCQKYSTYDILDKALNNESNAFLMSESEYNELNSKRLDRHRRLTTIATPAQLEIRNNESDHTNYYNNLKLPKNSSLATLSSSNNEDATDSQPNSSRPGSLVRLDSVDYT